MGDVDDVPFDEYVLPVMSVVLVLVAEVTGEVDGSACDASSRAVLDVTVLAELDEESVFGRSLVGMVTAVESGSLRSRGESVRPASPKLVALRCSDVAVVDDDEEDACN